VTSPTSARPPYDPELAASLAASPLPTIITPDMITSLRATPFTAPIAGVLSTRAVDREERTIVGPGANSPSRSSGPVARLASARGSTTCTGAA